MRRKNKKCISCVVALISSVAIAFSVLYQNNAVAFWDVSRTSLYYEAVNYVQEKGFLVGKDDGSFDPDGTLTRAEMAAIICRMAEKEEEPRGKERFLDVPRSHWAYGYIEAAARMGIINGYGNGNFGPYDSVTCVQVATILTRIGGRDRQAIELGGYPYGYFQLAQDQGLFSGMDIVVNEPCTRAEIAQMIYNGYQREYFWGELGMPPTGDTTSLPCALVQDGWSSMEAADTCPTVTFLPDMRCELVLNLGYKMKEVSGSFAVYQPNKQRTIVCELDEADLGNGIDRTCSTILFVEESNGSWTFMGEIMGFTLDGDKFRTKDSKTMDVELQFYEDSYLGYSGNWYVDEIEEGYTYGEMNVITSPEGKITYSFRMYRAKDYTGEGAVCDDDGGAYTYAKEDMGRGDSGERIPIRMYMEDGTIFLYMYENKDSELSYLGGHTFICRPK